jgi:hypothetical protein
MKRDFAVLLVVLSMWGCATGSKLQTVTTGETISVKAVHLVIVTEEDAYKAGAYPLAQHQKNIAALQKVVAAESALNDALRAWNANQGQPVPVSVIAAVTTLSSVYADLQPILGNNPKLTILLGNIATAIADLTKGLA